MEALRSAVAKLRRTLGDDVRKPRYVIGVRGLGYRMPGLGRRPRPEAGGSVAPSAHRHRPPAASSGAGELITASSPELFATNHASIIGKPLPITPNGRPRVTLLRTVRRR